MTFINFRRGLTPRLCAPRSRVTSMFRGGWEKPPSGNDGKPQVGSVLSNEQSTAEIIESLKGFVPCQVDFLWMPSWFVCAKKTEEKAGVGDWDGLENRNSKMDWKRSLKDLSETTSHHGHRLMEALKDVTLNSSFKVSPLLSFKTSTFRDTKHWDRHKMESGQTE